MDERKKIEQQALNEMNRILGSMFKSSSSYRYYRPSNPSNKSRKQDMYFYTTGKCTYKGGVKYISGVYRYNAQKKTWKAMKKAGHRKKKDAIARAGKLSQANA